MNKVFGILASLVLFGCATPYTSTGFMGGYSETAYAPDVYQVNFKGNAYTGMERAVDFTMLRAAEIAVSKGYKYMVLSSSESWQQSYSWVTSGTATTTGHGTATANTYGNTTSVQGSIYSTTTYNPPQLYTYYKPRTGMIFIFTNEEEKGGLDATFIHKSISEKYRIKRDSHKADSFKQ